MIFTNIPLTEHDPEPPFRSVVVDAKGAPWQRLANNWFAPGSSAFRWPWLPQPVTLVALPDDDDTTGYLGSL